MDLQKWVRHMMGSDPPTVSALQSLILKLVEDGEAFGVRRVFPQRISPDASGAIAGLSFDRVIVDDITHKPLPTADQLAALPPGESWYGYSKNAAEREYYARVDAELAAMVNAELDRWARAALAASFLSGHELATLARTIAPPAGAYIEIKPRAYGKSRPPHGHSYLIASDGKIYRFTGEYDARGDAVIKELSQREYQQEYMADWSNAPECPQDTPSGPRTNGSARSGKKGGRQ